MFRKLKEKNSIIQFEFYKNIDILEEKRKFFKFSIIHLQSEIVFFFFKFLVNKCDAENLKKKKDFQYTKFKFSKIYL